MRRSLLIWILASFCFVLLQSPMCGRRDRDVSMEGKIAFFIPDSMEMGKTVRVKIRVSNKDFDNYLLREKISSAMRPGDSVTIDTIPIASVMRINLQESGADKKLLIESVGSDIQHVDTSDYTEWHFDISAVNYGLIRLSVVAEILYYEDNHKIPGRARVYDKTLTITATPKQKTTVFFKDYYIVSIVIGAGLFLLLFKLIPSQKIITIMTNQNNGGTNFWAAGSFGIVVYLITIISLVVFKFLEIKLIYSLFVFIGTILLYILFTAVALFDKGKLKPGQYLQLVKVVLSKIPPLNFFFGKTARTPKEEED